MDWFRRQRRAKRVASDDESGALPAPEGEEGEERDSAEPISVPQPLLVELTPQTSRSSTLDMPQPLRVELAPPTPEIPQPLRVELSAQPLQVLPSSGPDVKAILAAEFAYIAQTTIQNNEDRVSAFFYTSAAAVVAATVTLRLDANSPGLIFAAFGIIFGVMVVLGHLAILQLAQLRAAWFSSIRAMNRIKRYYYSIYAELADWQPAGVAARDLPADHEETQGVFLWMKEPARDKPASIAFLRVTAIAIIDWLFATAAVTLLFISLNPASALAPTGNLVLPLVGGVLLGAIIFWLQRRAYFQAVMKD